MGNLLTSQSSIEVGVKGHIKQWKSQDDQKFYSFVVDGLIFPNTHNFHGHSPDLLFEGEFSEKPDQNLSGFIYLGGYSGNQFGLIDFKQMKEENDRPTIQQYVIINNLKIKLLDTQELCAPIGHKINDTVEFNQPITLKEGTRG